MFLRNHWYVAAWSEDVGRTPTARVILGEGKVLSSGREKSLGIRLDG